jgi:hypothetical protein
MLLKHLDYINMYVSMHTTLDASFVSPTDKGGIFYG